MESNTKKSNERFNENLPGFKKLVSDWKIEAANKNIIFTMGSSPPSKTYNTYEEGLPFLQGVSEFGTMNPEPEVWCSEPNKISEIKDILISVRAPVGTLNFSDQKYCIGRGLAALRPKEKLNGLYVYYHLLERRNWLSSIGAGSTFEAISKSDLTNLEIPIPPKPEQRKIASVLYTVDQAIQKTEEIIEQTKRVKKGLMQDLFTEGIANEKNKNRDSFIGKIKVPENWELEPLSNVVEKYINGGTPDTENTDYWGGEIPWTTGSYIKKVLVKEGKSKITKKGLKESATSIVTKGEILVVTRTGVGIIAKTGVDMAISQDLTGLIIDKQKCLPDYLLWYLLSRKKQLKRLRQGTTIKGIIRKHLEKFPIPLPPMSEQKRISSIFYNFEKSLEQNDVYLDNLKRLKKGLMQDLLTGEVRTDDKDIEVLDEVMAHG